MNRSSDSQNRQIAPATPPETEEHDARRQASSSRVFSRFGASARRSWAAAWRGIGWRWCAGLVLCFWLQAAGAAEAFRFAWLSDTHVGSATGEADLRAAVTDINSMTGLSFVLVSGDVTEYGSLAQLGLAREILSGLNVPCHIIPGNHDTKWSESGATDFARLWGADRFVFECGGYCFIGMHEGPVMKMGDGHWAPQDVRWLRQVLQRMRYRQQPIIFVTHYPIDPGIANWYVVLDLLKRYNTQAVLCGHGHANHQYFFEGVPGVMGRSNLRARGEVGGFNLVEVRDGQMTLSTRMTGRDTQPPWHTVQLCRHNYAADTNRYPRPDFSINATYPQVKEKWVFKTGYTIASTPAIAGDIAAVGDGSGSVYGISTETGKPRWKFHTGNAVWSTPATDDRRFVMASTDGNIYALEAVTGKELWRFHSTRPIVASPAIGAGTVFIGSSEGCFRALDLETGKLRWRFDGLGGFVETRPLVCGSSVVFGAWDEHLYSLDAQTGALRWKWRGDRRGTLLSPAACCPIEAEGKIFVVAPDRKMTAINAADGQQVWRTGEYVVRESIGLSEDRTRFYVRAMNDFFYAFSTAAAEPQKAWELNARFGYDINSAMLQEKEGVVFYGAKNGLLFAIDALTGELQWEHKFGVGVMNTVLPLSRDRVVATDFDGEVALIVNGAEAKTAHR